MAEVCNVLQYSTVKYTTIQVQYSTAPYSTVL
jgi:hypothetical protein